MYKWYLYMVSDLQGVILPASSTAVLVLGYLVLVGELVSE
jgi:hypothetical protein